TGLDIANASLLDEATAVAEAVLLMRRAVKKGTTVVLDSELHPPTISVVRARARAMDFRVTVADPAEGLPGADTPGIACAQPGPPAPSPPAPKPSPAPRTAGHW